MITVENQLFSLHTRHTSYLFRVMETGHLEHLYYGRKNSSSHRRIDGTACICAGQYQYL